MPSAIIPADLEADRRLWDTPHIMSERSQPSPISDPLRRAILDAIESGRETYLGLEQATGVTRASIMRFVKGKQSLRLDIADRLAAHFGLSLRLTKKGK